jgi:phage terminase large subunit
MIAALEDLPDDVGALKASFMIDSSGRTVIEAKDQMKRRGLRSCDLADALAATFYSSGVLGSGAAIFEIMRRAYDEQQRKRAAS